VLPSPKTSTTSCTTAARKGEACAQLDDVFIDKEHLQHYKLHNSSKKKRGMRTIRGYIFRQGTFPVFLDKEHLRHHKLDIRHKGIN
jgi:hypothetical protein